MQININNYKGTPQIEPLQYQFTQSFLTPFQGSLSNLQNIEQFDLDNKNNDHILSSLKSKYKKHENFSNKQISLLMNRNNRQLQQVIQNQDESQEQNSYSESQCESIQDIAVNKQLENHQDKYIVSNLWIDKTKSKQQYSKSTDLQRQTIYQNQSIFDYSNIIDIFSHNPQSTMINKIKSLFKESTSAEQQTLGKIKHFIESYILQYENYCFQQSWKLLLNNYQSFMKNITTGIKQTFAKRIGKLSFEQRRLKILKYLQKKSKKIWKKKVSYDCRKKVADGRLRIKGKFVTRQQVCQLLGYDQLDNYSIDQIKQMLQKKYEPNDLKIVISQEQQQSQ